MAYETIKLAAVRALLGTCTSRAISAEQFEGLKITVVIMPYKVCCVNAEV